MGATAFAFCNADAPIGYSDLFGETSFEDAFHPHSLSCFRPSSLIGWNVILFGQGLDTSGGSNRGCQSVLSRADGFYDSRIQFLGDILDLIIELL